MDGIGPVLITGASSGIGRKTTEFLAERGHLVYAAVRKQSDLRALAAVPNVEPLILDVTDARQISDAVVAVEERGRGLYGLVNNAGIATLGPIVDGNDAEFNSVMEVNVRGPYQVTRAFAPSVIRSKGRIVTLGSISGILAQKHLSAYSMSKHAIEAFTDCLAVEMEPHGVQVSVIEPGDFNTRIALNAVDRIGADPGLPDMGEYDEPDAVAAAIAHALFDECPKRRYLVVTRSLEAERTIRKQIAQLVQLNEGHGCTYDRERLVAMLDETLDDFRRDSLSVSGYAGVI